MQRREFLKLAGAAVASGMTAKQERLVSSESIVIVLQASTPELQSEPVRHAIENLRSVLKVKGNGLREVSTVASAKGSRRLIVLSASRPAAASAEQESEPELVPEGFHLVPGGTVLHLIAKDVRGFVYGLGELADRVTYSKDARLGLEFTEPVFEAPANRVRSVARSYVSDIEDRAWFYDKRFWPEYLDMLVANRFNRFALTFGLNYDYPKGVTEDYMHFLYPYLFDVPGYSVRVEPALAPGEQERNFEAIQYIARESARRGLEFQLGLWSQGYEWVESPEAQHRITGLTPEKHARYCRDALALILKECPEITGLTFRIHEESGIPQGSYGFWGTYFEAIEKCGRRVEIDLHAKSLKQPMMDTAVRTRQPLLVSPKFAGEHAGLGYHQAAIRDMEIPRSYSPNHSGKFDLGNGVKGYLRYGFGDLFQEGRPYDILYRVWPGTQRHLLWGDPVTAAAWSRAGSFNGGIGMEWFEPLAFKGREGSGVPGGRNAYADRTLEPVGADWRKFEYWYRVVGRTLYRPDTESDVWNRYLQRDFGPGAGAVETALSEAGRLLPLVTQAYMPSTANQWYWPELYTHLQIVPGGPAPYYDSPEPLSFGTASALDPRMFASASETARELLAGTVSGKYTGLEVADWLDRSVHLSMKALDASRREVPSVSSSAFRRMEEDVLLQNRLGTFFAEKMRAGLFYELFAQSGDVTAGRLAVEHLRKARDTWENMAERARTVYRLNIAYGDRDDRRGHWVDRLPAIDADLAALEAKVKGTRSALPGADSAAAAVLASLRQPRRRALVGAFHRPSDRFVPGRELGLRVMFTGGGVPAAAQLWYRHLNQAERWQSLAMQLDQGDYVGGIPAGYTDSPFPLQYFFELHPRGEGASTYPEFTQELTGQPYFLVSKRD